jgi:hypothetical protein
VVGQSLGGGLAGLVAGICNVKSYAISPAPFANYLETYAKIEAAKQLNIDLADLAPAFGMGGWDSAVELANQLSSQSLESQLVAYGLFVAEYGLELTVEFTQLWTAKLNAYEDHVGANLEVHTIDGESLSSDPTDLDGTGAMLGLGADHFDVPVTSYDLGTARSTLSTKACDCCRGLQSKTSVRIARVVATSD